jgi:hypothetical protein
MTTPLEKTLRRALTIKGGAYILAISPEGLKLTVKGRRKGLELHWEALVSGDAALAVALNASLGQLQAKVPTLHQETTRPATAPGSASPATPAPSAKTSTETRETARMRAKRTRRSAARGAKPRKGARLRTSGR